MILFLLLFLAGHASAQDGTTNISGTVTDSGGQPLPGATVTVLGTTRGAMTDNDGTYTITARPSDKLVFTFIGMETQIIDVGNQVTINVNMTEQAEELDIVTVVAFGKQKKASVVGSISTVTAEEIKVPYEKNTIIHGCIDSDYCLMYGDDTRPHIR